MFKQAIALWAVGLGSLLAAAQAADPPLDLGSVTELHEMVPMRDGVRLSTYIYLAGRRSVARVI